MHCITTIQEVRSGDETLTKIVILGKNSSKILIYQRFDGLKFGYVPDNDEVLGSSPSMRTN